VLPAFLASLVLGLLVGYVLMRRARASLGPTWEDWLYAEQIGGRWKPLIVVASAAAAAIGILGLGTPGWVQGALLGGIVGFCLPFGVEGTTRFTRRSPR
jgi:hypothetical protein